MCLVLSAMYVLSTTFSIHFRLSFWTISIHCCMIFESCPSSLVQVWINSLSRTPKFAKKSATSLAFLLTWRNCTTRFSFKIWFKFYRRTSHFQFWDTLEIAETPCNLRATSMMILESPSTNNVIHLFCTAHISPTPRPSNFMTLFVLAPI